jgi:hypothetical protein
MLHCNMNHLPDPLQLSLEDLLGDLQHARRHQDMSRLALLAYCEVRRWARQAGEEALAERSAELITRSPPASRDQFMHEVDGLMEQLQQVHARIASRSNAQTAG